jgi:sugar/nucleoside kinase (ribokinase family)
MAVKELTYECKFYNSDVFGSSAEGVTVHYQVSEEAPTGTCAVLVTGTHRSLCANLAAAQKFTVDHLSKEECKKSIEAAKFFYASVGTMQLSCR